MRESVGRIVFPVSPGLYVVYRRGHERPLYVGVAGTQTIADRWCKQHRAPAAARCVVRSAAGLNIATGLRRKRVA